jgi:transposase
MNVFFAKILMYHQIQQLDTEGYSLSKIGSLTGLDRRTVKRYLAMTEKEFEAFQDNLSDRKKQLLPYEQFVKEKLEVYRDTSAAQMHDWLKEHYVDFPKVNPKTVFNFVHWIRDRYNLPVLQQVREYETVPETAYGRQAQVDFGEYTMRTSTDSRIKVFFFSMMLARSRYKYLWFTIRNFTADLAVFAHEKAFEFFDGIPEEIVYDQDKVFLVSENKGDLILTTVFRQYVQGKGFKLRFCRKSDPESKGKIENVIKYIKNNFLYNRTFYNEETLNDEAISWLGRTANALPHSFTRKEPREEWIIEKNLLKTFIPEVRQVPSMTYMVRKDNTISWKGNFYTVPYGTYRGRGSCVVVREELDNLIMLIPQSLQELCRHAISLEKGIKIINTDHKRNKLLQVEELMLHVANRFNNPLTAKDWLGEIYKLKARYMRDQLQIIQQVLDQPEVVTVANQAMTFCHQNKVHSAVDFKAIIQQHLKDLKPQERPGLHILNPLTGDKLDKNIQPQKSSIQDYQQLVKK